jgi:hypothetical protein
MSALVDQWKAQLSALSTREKAELAHFLLISLESEDEDAEVLWDEEASKRVDEICSGSAHGRPVGELLEELREQFP